MAESEYQSTLDYEAKKRYKEKLMLKSEQIPDPYAVSQEEWVDDGGRLSCMETSTTI